MNKFRHNVEINYKNKNFECFPIDWVECDESSLVEEEEERYYDKNYKILLFANTIEGHSVSIKINNFKPYFYLKIPENWDENDINKFKTSFLEAEEINFYGCKEKIKDEEFIKLKDKITSKKIKSYLLHEETEIVEKEIFWTFTNFKKFKFLKLYFKNKEGYRLFSNFFLKATKYPGFDKKIEMKVFESNLEPLLKFFHDKNIKPSNWVSIPTQKCISSYKLSHSQLNFEIDYNNINSIEKDVIPPMIVASFDIEADSSHGDFPLAIKDYKKLANELYINFFEDIRKNINIEDYNYFKERICYAFDKKNKNILYDDKISKVFCKKKNENDELNKVKIKHLLSNIKFDKICKEIFLICNRKNKKIIANQKMKKVIDTINNVFNAQNEKELELYKKQLKLPTLINIIKYYAKQHSMSFLDLKFKILSKDVLVRFINNELNSYFPKVKGDKCIQIGTTFWRYGEDKPFYNNIITLNQSSPLENIDTYSYKKEGDVLMKWVEIIKKIDPDIILGYNIFGFDERFMYDRAIELFGKNKNKLNDFLNMGRLKKNTYSNIWTCQGKLNKKKLASSALGSNYLEYFNTPGRVQIDLLKVVQGSFTKLDSYKLDNVAEYYISGNILECINNKTYKVDNIGELEKGNYIKINFKTGEKYKDGQKIIINHIDYENSTIELNEEIDKDLITIKSSWGISKDDVTPQQIFEFQKGTDVQRSIIAKYCIQDCALVIRLLKKLDTITNNLSMSNVSIVPFSYIFMRGQSIKVFSVICNECNKNNYVIPVLNKKMEEEEDLDIHKKSIDINLIEKEEEEIEEQGYNLKNNFNEININGDGFEGAIVLKPKPGIYTDDPITVLDFASLYPSEMIASNLSHECHCEDPYWLGDKGNERIKKLGYDCIDRKYDIYSLIDKDNPLKGKIKTGITSERFIQLKDGKKGLIPNVLMKLLKARKDTKKKMKTETDPFKYKILDGLQQAFKVMCNSVYGGIGAQISNIYKKAIAACTTAGGRKCIYMAKSFCEKENSGCDVVYGDTDSVFVKFNLQNKDGSYPKTDAEKIQKSIDIGVNIQNKMKDEGYFPNPHDLEYEKVFYPLILITKKRYVGEKYEFDVNKGKLTSMGIVLKRRDNAQILKHVYSGVINIIMKDKDIQKAIDFTQQCCREILNKKYDLSMFIITKTLRDFYKDPESIAHKVLAERMGERDIGTKPAVNERIPYAYIKVENKNKFKLLQGDKIEHIDYIKKHNLELDFNTYISNQLLKPISQIFELIIEKINNFPYPLNHYDMLYNVYLEKYNNDIKKTEKKISSEKQKLIKKIIFDTFLLENKTNLKINTFYKMEKKNINTKKKEYVKIEHILKKQKSIKDWLN